MPARAARLRAGRREAMLAAMRSTAALGFALALGALGHPVHADPPSLATLEKALPAGWTLLATDSELVLRHDRPCYRGEAAAPTKRDGALITLELRYKLGPAWTPAQYADARKANAAVAQELEAARARYRIDAIKAPAHPTADERARLDAYAHAETTAASHRVREPLCTLGDDAIFDGDETYAALAHPIDPPEAMREARAVVELVKRTCGAK